jgi:hypothetical protein
VLLTDLMARLAMQEQNIDKIWLLGDLSRTDVALLGVVVFGCCLRGEKLKIDETWLLSDSTAGWS